MHFTVSMLKILTGYKILKLACEPSCALFFYFSQIFCSALSVQLFLKKKPQYHVIKSERSLIFD